MNVHVFADTAEYYIAETLEQAMEMQRQYLGENPGEDEDWSQCADEDELFIWLNDESDVTEHGSGMPVLGAFCVWAESYDPGFLCSTEY